MRRREFFVGAGALAMLAGCASPGKPDAVAAAPAAPAAPPAKIGPWGFDLAGMDRSVRPGDDFNLYANGGWIRTVEIPADRSVWNSFGVLAEEANANVRAILEELAAKGGAPGSIEQKLADFYRSYLDVAAIDAKGLEPIKPMLDAINGARNYQDLVKVIARSDVSTDSPIGWGISIDQKNPDRYIVTVTHSGLGLPNRTFYNGPNAQADLVKAYEAHVARMLGLAGVARPDAKAKDIVAFESAVAELHWLPAARREREKTYNPKTRAELKALAPAFPWDDALAASELAGVNDVIVRELDAMAPLATLMSRTRLETLKAYCTYHALRLNADVLPTAFDQEQFAFFGKTLNGQPAQRERQKRAVDAVSAALGEAVGQLYVARHFPPESKAKMLDLVENLRKAYGKRIEALDWMSADTKKVALEKLAAFRPKIGYPDKWRDYSALEIKAGDAFGNGLRADLFDYRRRVARLNSPTDRDEWFMTPFTVNAYYNSQFNEIVFPAAILQAPFFDPNADPAVNYGGIGGVIGHEMGHGFDDQGSKSDAKGVLRTWWSEGDLARFKERTDSLAAQYSKYEALPGLFLDGRLGLGENIGDNGGLQVAYEAYRLSLAGKEAPVLDGFTGDQRFFLGWAQVWRAKFREEALRNRVKIGPHSPDPFRAKGAPRNMDSWYAAFDVQPTDKLYLAANDRVRIW